ncbi:YbaK/EbsC family protein [Inediibacterium massiliense]|uniref:YbaK/EbsC family protein n=1 Tax=Inediibacterium massiliense TaxID=1658111 RepID=UPI0006B4E312|nr:YbaK/EbsC family protein [Inediibacterium massiliense]
MELSNVYVHTYKEITSEVEKISERNLIKAGMLQKISGAYAYLPLGHKMLTRIQEQAKKVLEQNGFEEILFLGNQDGFLKKVKKGMKKDKVFFYQVEQMVPSRENKRGSLFIKGEVVYKDVKEIKKDFFFIEDLCNEVLRICGLNGEKIKDIHNQEDILSSIIGIPSEEGKENIVSCSCGYKATQRYAPCKKESFENEVEFSLEKVYTPDVKTIDQLTKFLGITSKKLIKCLLLKNQKNFIAAFVRGDRELNLAKLEKTLGFSHKELVFLKEEEVETLTHAKVGFAGPIGLENTIIVVDYEVTHMKNAVAGANETDFHIKNINYGRDFKADYILDIKNIEQGDSCVNCGEDISVYPYMEMARIEKEKDKISFSLDITSILSGIASIYYDEYGLTWPISLSFYPIILSILNMKDQEQVDFANQIYEKLKGKNIEVLLDDRNEKIGVKFQDAELLGIPIQIIVGRGAKDHIVEYKIRTKEYKKEFVYNELFSQIQKDLQDDM